MSVRLLEKINSRGQCETNKKDFYVDGLAPGWTVTWSLKKLDSTAPDISGTVGGEGDSEFEVDIPPGLGCFPYVACASACPPEQ